MITRENYKVPELKNLKFDKKTSDTRDFFRADVIGGRSFVLNDGGYPLNDVDLIVRQQDLKVAESLLSQLEEVPTSGVPADTPNETVLMSLKSRYQQAPAELIKFYEHQLEIKEAAALVNQPSTDGIKFEDTDATVSDS